MGEPLTDSQSTSGVGQRPQGLRVGSPAQQDPPDYDPLINAHAALVFVSAALIGLVVGVLTFLGTANAPLSAVAGLSAIGAAVGVLHKMIGR